jgi:hypothetical protein
LFFDTEFLQNGKGKIGGTRNGMHQAHTKTKDRDDDDDDEGTEGDAVLRPLGVLCILFGTYIKLHLVD